MFQMRSLLLILLPALLPRHHIVVEGESTVSPATRGSSLVSCKEFTFTVEDLKNAKSDEELLNIWSSKMAEVVEFIGDNLQTQNGDIIINTAIVSHDATTATAVAIGTSTIATDAATSHAPFVTSITGTNTITSSDAIWHTPLAAIMGGTSVTLYTLAETTIAEETNSTPELYTCYQLQKYNGTAVSGIYAMSSLMDEYEVHCNFSSGTAVTEVWHNSMQEIKSTTGCWRRGCYSWSPEYEVSAKNILRIIENSRECKQYIKVRCKGMMLMRADYGFYGWWVSRQGEKMLYWGGATSRRDGYCACGETGSCADNNYKCNCDQNYRFKIVQDDGFLNDTSKLPVRELKFGDMNDFGEESWHTLGKLECTGQSGQA